MKKIFTTTLFALGFTNAIAQTSQDTCTFEGFNLDPESAYINFDNPMTNVGFDEKNVHFPCYYDTSYGGFWSSGFSYSNITDTTTGTMINQYAAKARGGFQSDQYVVAYGNENYIKIKSTNGPSNSRGPVSMKLTNSTFVYHTMLMGDAFSKKFGGDTGNDPDYFLLTIKGYNQGILNDSLEIYLADFRNQDNSKDYILKDWTHVDLTSLGIADSLTFHLSSSDNGSWGMNTPAYFCLDNIVIGDFPTSIQNVEENKNVILYPNPASDFIVIKSNNSPKEELYNIIDYTGKSIRKFKSNGSNTTVHIQDLPQGSYIIRSENGWFKNFVKW